MDFLEKRPAHVARPKSGEHHVPLYSTAELARQFGVVPMTISSWSKLPEFPKPSAIVRRGHFKVKSFAYELPAVIEWVRKYRPTHLSTQSTELSTDSRGPT